MFAQRLLDWHREHGRHDLPWQHPRSPYRVWVSEIMLQQTQVATVIPYFLKFMARLPDLPTLAGASDDEVMALWAGLGYYSRARNLHRSAQICVAQHNGDLPGRFDDLVALPGIGRSTAGAILAQAFDEPYPILDGNAKRVLARFHAVAGWPGKSTVLRALWDLAEQTTPSHSAADYAQAIMDLGATVCTRQPACLICPLKEDCQGAAAGDPTRYPGRRPRKAIPLRKAFLCLVENEAGEVLLEKRPPRGIWGGLWSLPVEESAVAGKVRFAAPFVHTFTHFKLELTPLRAGLGQLAVEDRQTQWVDPEEALGQMGLPKPVRAFLTELQHGDIRWRPSPPPDCD
ncbi:MAG: A/G-specific adenine glycosylase [Pseudomonadota bacterium]